MCTHEDRGRILRDKKPWAGKGIAKANFHFPRRILFHPFLLDEIAQRTDYNNRRIIAKLLDVIALSRRRNPPPPTSGAKIRRKVIHDMCTFLSLFLSLLFTLSVSLSLDGVDRVRETGLERAPVNTLGQGRRERMDTYRRKRRRDCF